MIIVEAIRGGALLEAAIDTAGVPIVIGQCRIIKVL